MPKQTIKEHIAVLKEQNITQTKSIDSLSKIMHDHDALSQTFRQRTLTNATDIGWLRWGVRGLYGSGLVSIVVWLIVKYIKQ